MAALMKGHNKKNDFEKLFLILQHTIRDIKMKYSLSLLALEDAFRYYFLRDDTT